ncbi:MAG: hypothetical protein Q7U16_14570 [Agitococcus sp.]|nr:hypothetical protein [Agitococcus sp.]
MNSVYRFHGSAQDADGAAPFLLRKRKAKRSQEFYYLAADELTITDANGTRPIEEFQNLSCYSAVTLTRREADLIALANPGMCPPTALEDMHPWLPRRSFVPASEIGYRSLTHIRAKYGRHLISASAYCDLAWNTACNAMRRKTSLDKRFQMAWHIPIQDVFVLEERRVDRSVIAIDVNAMYSACMQHDIPHPAAVFKIEFGRDYLVGEKLAAGLYRCQLSSSRTEFIQRHNPFTTFFCGRRLRASLHEIIEVDLNEFEVVYFAQHFVRIHILDAVIANKVVPHPLSRESKRAFSRRKNYRTQGNKPFADREKYLATLLSSCGNRPSITTKKFIDRFSVMAYLSDAYGISPPADEPEAATCMWISRSKRIALAETSAGICVVSPSQDDRSTCFMLAQRIVAHGRIHLLKLMQWVLALNSDADICYVNIDSVHFSVPTAKLDSILELLRAEASEEMGAFKIESVTAHGLWLEPGRYWLYSNNVEKFRNRSIGDGAQPFQDRSFHVATRQIDDLHIPIKASVRMDKSMSHVRTLHQDNDGFVRQRLVERNSASSFSETLDLLESSRRSDTALRLEAFQNLKHRIDNQACSAASEQA